MDETYYVFYPDKTVEVHETWPDKSVPAGTIFYQPSDAITPWFRTNGRSQYSGESINYKYDVPAWIKAYALLIQ